MKFHRESIRFASMLSIDLRPMKIMSQVTCTNSLQARWAAYGMQIMIMHMEIQNER
jgi:hypothetical protein